MDTTRLTQVINTLNQIEVQGKDNLNKLLGCILVLEDIVKVATQPEESYDPNVVPGTVPNEMVEG